MAKIKYQSDDYYFSLHRKTGEYTLGSRKYKISITISGDDAVLFGKHIELLTSKPDKTLNRRIEKTIGIHLFFCIYNALEDDTIKNKIGKP
jgi:hypothetical protein